MIKKSLVLVSRENVDMVTLIRYMSLSAISVISFSFFILQIEVIDPESLKSEDAKFVSIFKNFVFWQICDFNRIILCHCRTSSTLE